MSKRSSAGWPELNYIARRQLTSIEKRVKVVMTTFSRMVIIVLFAGCFEMNGRSVPKYGVSELISPNKKYVLRLSDTKEPWTYELKIFRKGAELAHYPFLGILIGACWDPTSRFVAMNTHYGHGGYNVWIISLVDGSTITAHGVARGPEYDYYTDQDYYPYLPRVAAAELRKIYPDVDNDPLRNGYPSVAYGWKSDNRLLMFHELAFDNFHPNENVLIEAFTTWKVTEREVTLESVRVRKARDDQYEPMPPEARKTLNFIP